MSRIFCFIFILFCSQTCFASDSLATASILADLRAFSKATCAYVDALGRLKELEDKNAQLALIEARYKTLKSASQKKNIRHNFAFPAKGLEHVHARLKYHLNHKNTSLESYVAYCFEEDFASTMAKLIKPITDNFRATCAKSNIVNLASNIGEKDYDALKGFDKTLSSLSAFQRRLALWSLHGGLPPDPIEKEHDFFTGPYIKWMSRYEKRHVERCLLLFEAWFEAQRIFLETHQ